MSLTRLPQSHATSSTSSANAEGTSEQSPLLPQEPAPRNSTARDTGLLSGLRNRVSAALTQPPPNRMTLGPKFSDGSVRPDELAATKIDVKGGATYAAGIKGGAAPTDPILRNAAGQAIHTGNHYPIPEYHMKGLAAGKEPHTDSHMHDTNYVQRGLQMKRKLRMMDEIGVRTSTSMPIPTSLLTIQNGRLAVNRHLAAHAAGGNEHTHHCGPLESYYVPLTVVQRVRDLRGDQTHELTMQDFKDYDWLLNDIVNVGELYVDTAVNGRLAMDIKNSNLTEAERSRIDPMLTGFHLGDSRISDKFLMELATYPGTFTGIGEITVNKELVQKMFAGKIQTTAATDGSQGTGDSLEPLIGLIQTAGIVGAPVVLHCDIDDLEAQVEDHHTGRTDRPQAHFEGLKAMFNDPRVKDSKVVWAHGGGLGRFVQEGDGHLDKLKDLMATCPNLYLDISWSEVAKQVTRDPQALDQWATFLEENSSRVCFGSDTLAPVNIGKWEETKQLYAPLFAKISKEAKDDILNHTYENVFVGSRAKVRWFEENVLTKEFQDAHLRNSHVLDDEGQPVQPLQFAPVVTPEVLKAAVQAVPGHFEQLAEPTTA